MSYQNILFDVTDGVARLTLNRPERLNSFNTEHARGGACGAAARVAESGARVLVLTGAGRGFCAGQDLNDRAVAPGGAPPDLGESIEKNYKPLVLALRALPMPVIAAVNGVAAGAGANIALACDLVIAARSASFVQAFAKLGLVPDSGGTWFLPRLVGTARAHGARVAGRQAVGRTGGAVGPHLALRGGRGVGRVWWTRWHATSPQPRRAGWRAPSRRSTRVWERTLRRAARRRA